MPSCVRCSRRTVRVGCARDELEHLGRRRRRRGSRTRRRARRSAGAPPSAASGAAAGRSSRRAPRAHRRGTAPRRVRGPTRPRSASHASGGWSSGSAAKRRDVGLVAPGEAVAFGESGLRAGRARARRGCRAAPRPRWCHVHDAHRARDFRPPRPDRRRRLHDRRGRRSSPSSSSSCATRSAAWSASSTCSRKGTAAEGHATLRMYNLLAKDPAFQAMPVHPSVLPIVERLLDRGCLLSGMTAIDIGPGEHAQPMHGDDIVMSRHLQRAARADDGDEHVGAHRLHRRQRRDAVRARLAPLRRTRPTCRARSTASTCARSRCRPVR